MTPTAVAQLRSKVKRAYTILNDQDAEILRLSAQVGESQSFVVRDLLARGLADKLAEDALKAKGRKG